MKLLKILGFFIGLFGVVFVGAVRAQENFETSSHITYKINADGTANISHQFKVKNLTPTTYLSQHSLKLSYPTLKNIRATTGGSAIQPEIKNEGNTTQVTLNFDESVVGEGQTREFTVIYNTPDVAQVLGEVLEVRVPVLNGADNFSSHEVTIVVPGHFGDPVRQEPKPDNITKEFTDTTYYYTGIKGKGISLQFGNEQYFAVQTEYPLINSSSSPAYGQIALPPDTSFQRFQYESLEPRPESTKVDADGNWIATYLVPPNETTVVKLDAKVKIMLDPDPAVPVPEWKTEYMVDKKYWDLSEALFGDVFGSQNKDEIYKTVIEKLNYDVKRVEAGELSGRAGATGALENPDAAVCQEYADLLVAAWRRAGVPARRLNGYGYTTNQSTRPSSLDGTVLHTWVEYHDPALNLWKPVDPTWEDTTGGVDYYNQFDLNHIVFSIFGSSSEEPYPAGAYADESDKTVLAVQLTEPFQEDAPEIKPEFLPVKVGNIDIPGQHTLTISNKSGRAWYDVELNLKSEGVKISPDFQRFHLLPFEKKTFAVNVNSPLQSGIIQKEVELTLTPKNKEAQIHHVTLSAAPAVVKQLSSLNIATPVGGAALLLLVGAGSLLVFRRKRKPALRWQSQKLKKEAEQLQTAPSPDSTDQADGTSGKESGVEGTQQRTGSITYGSGIDSVVPTARKRSPKGR